MTESNQSNESKKNDSSSINLTAIILEGIKILGVFSGFLVVGLILLSVSSLEAFSSAPIDKETKKYMFWVGFSLLSVAAIGPVIQSFWLKLLSENTSNPKEKSVNEAELNNKQDQIKVLNESLLQDSGRVETIYNQELMHNAVKNIFKGINTGDRVFQTFIGAYPIPGNRDLIDSMEEGVDCEVFRLFGLSNAYEINFAQASFEKSRSIKTERGGKIKLGNHYYYDELTNYPSGVTTNITLSESSAVVTFKSSTYENDNLKGKQLIRLPELYAGPTTAVALVVNKENSTNRSLIDYFHNQWPHNDLHEIKKRLFEKDPFAYQCAIAFAVMKEVISTKELNVYEEENKGKTKVGYAGIVGSLADAIRNNKVSTSVNDIDLLFFLSKDSISEINSFVEAAKNAARRYSIEDVLKVTVDEKMSAKLGTEEKVFNVQLIINDFCPQSQKPFVSSKESSCFSMATRLHCNVALEGDLDDFYSLKTSISSLLDPNEPFSIPAFRYYIKSSTINERYWDDSLYVMKERLVPLEKYQMQHLMDYAKKWCLINAQFLLNPSEVIGKSFGEILNDSLLYHNIKALESLDALEILDVIETRVTQ